jgi:hypothetical protein
MNAGFGQSPDIPLNKDVYHLLNRYEVLSGRLAGDFHTSIKPYPRKPVAGFFVRLDSTLQYKSKSDQYNIDHILTDNYDYADYPDARSRKPFLKHLYQYKNDFLAVNENDFQLHLNPVLYFSGGIDKGQNVTPYINTRGLEASGMIAGKIGFYTFLSTTQAAYPVYVRNWISRNKAVPYEGFWKVFHKDGVDFFDASGYVTFNVVKPVTVEFGHGKTFDGNGIRSMVLSDFSNNYLYLKINTKVWKFNYFNLFARNYADAYTAGGGGSAGGNYPKKFLAHHHLSYDITKNLNIGVFETVMIGDSTQSFDIGYLNPIIFYRALEQQSGSRDNAMVGADLKWNFLQHFSLYGQFLLDEFLLHEVTAGNGWWGNKYGAQAGLKYFNVAGVDNLDAQVEFNIARPYTYTHNNIYTNFTNYRMPLAHPYGANFREYIVKVRYQPLPRIVCNIEAIHSGYGEDDNTSNWGKDIMKSYETRERDYGNYVGQGYYTHLDFLDFVLTYEFKFNVFFDLELTIHNVKSEYAPLNLNTTYAGVNFRWNIGRKIFDF